MTTIQEAQKIYHGEPKSDKSPQKCLKFLDWEKTCNCSKNKRMFFYRYLLVIQAHTLVLVWANIKTFFIPSTALLKIIPPFLCDQIPKIIAIHYKYVMSGLVF